MRFLVDAQLPLALAHWLGNTRTRGLLAWFETALPAALEAMQRGETLVEMI